jgi:hypothetical protein
MPLLFSVCDVLVPESHNVQDHVLLRQKSFQQNRNRLYGCMCIVCCAEAQDAVLPVGRGVEAGVSLSCHPYIGQSWDQLHQCLQRRIGENNGFTCYESMAMSYLF